MEHLISYAFVEFFKRYKDIATSYLETFLSVLKPYYLLIPYPHITLPVILLILMWNLIPVISVLTFPGVPFTHRVKAAKCMISAGVRGLLVIIPNLTAPIVVPIALLFTKWEDEKLPSLFWFWDNNASINGDKVNWTFDETLNKEVPMRQSLDPNDAQAIGFCYYAPGHHPRSFIARYIWLGLRNRASLLAKKLGYEYNADSSTDRDTWGDPLVSRQHVGKALYRCGSAYQFYSVSKLGSKFCIRRNTGFKVWGKQDYESGPAMVVNITFSIMGWEGE